MVFYRVDLDYFMAREYVPANLFLTQFSSGRTVSCPVGVASLIFAEDVILFHN
jgi:hypothetical protein